MELPVLDSGGGASEGVERRSPQGSLGEERAVKANAFRSPLRLQSDHRLVELLRGGVEPAFEVVVQRYRLPLIRYCGRLVGQDHAEDVVQETFAAAYIALRSDNRPIQLKPWLYRIARNMSVNVLRRKGSTYEELDENFDGVTQPHEHLERKQRVKALIEQISALPERQRAAIVLQELEGRTPDEIGAELDVTVPVVRQLVYRARERLRNGVGALVPRTCRHERGGFHDRSCCCLPAG